MSENSPTPQLLIWTFKARNRAAIGCLSTLGYEVWEPKPGETAARPAFPAFAYFDGDHRWAEEVPAGVPRLVRVVAGETGTPLVAQAVWCDGPGAKGAALSIGYPAGRLFEFLSSAASYAALKRIKQAPGQLARESQALRLSKRYRYYGGVGFPPGPYWDAQKIARRALVVTGHGGPYGVLGACWVDGFRRCGVQAAMALGDPEEIDAWEPDLIVVLYVRSAWDRNRDFYRLAPLGRTAFLCYEDPYESRRFAHQLHAIGPSLLLSTDPGTILSGTYGRKRNVWYAPHCWSPLLMPTSEDRAEAKRIVKGFEDLAPEGERLSVATLGHNYATRFEFFSSYPYLWRKYKWLTVGKDYHMNVAGLQSKGFAMPLSVALCDEVGLHVSHHRTLTTAKATWAAPVAATNMNMTVVQLAAAGVLQISDERPSVRHHFGDMIPLYRTAIGLMKQIDYVKGKDRFAEEELRPYQQETVLGSRSTYEDRARWIVERLGMSVPIDGRGREHLAGGWDPIRAEDLEAHQELSKPGHGPTEGQKGKMIL